jgi:hypothetical protein
VDSTIRRCAIAATLTLMAWSGSSIGAGDTYYRWNDASGTPVNSDRPPPPGFEYDTVTTNTNTRVDERIDPAESPRATSTGYTAEQPSTSAPRMEFEKSPEACEVAKQNLETLNTHARIRMPDGNGSFRFLNEDEKTTQRTQAEAAIAKNCE